MNYSLCMYTCFYYYNFNISFDESINTQKRRENKNQLFDAFIGFIMS